MQEVLKSRWWRIAAAIVLVAGLEVCSRAAAPCQRMVIPAYFYPGPLWDQASAGAPKVGTMILNPNSGPGAAQNPDYVAAARKARAAGIKLIGYVHTSYGNRDSATVKAEIDAYKTWYQVDGIFLDEVATDTASLPYYQDLANYLRAAPGTLVMLNPGTVPAEAYLGVGDIVVVFEGAYKTYKGLQLPGWVSRYPAERFAHLIYAAAGTAAMNGALSLSQQRNAGHVYVTGDTLPNPWNTLPGYWSQELQKLPATCP